MRPSRGELRWALLNAALALAFLMPGTGSAEERAAAPVLSWETGEGKSYYIPALEIPAFIAGLNLFNRYFIDPDVYGTDGHSIWKNLKSAQVIDKDPFSVNQLGHPYQGSIYYGFARSAGLNYWQSLGYSLAGSYLWETVGETTPPSLNDHIASGIGGTFVGEAMFRMASLLLEGGGDTPGFWRELGAAVLSPPTGFNRLVFGDRFAAVFPSRDPAIFIRLRLGATIITNVDNAGLSNDVKRQEGNADFSMTYGLPGKPGYQYTRPFDYFHFEFTAVPNASTVANAIENVSIRGLLAGAKYEWGDAYRGVWGLFGGYDYFSPQIFRVSSTAVSLGTTAQWWLARAVALQGTALAGLGFGAAGTVADKEERDYHYGLIPQALLGLRLILGDRAMLEATGRQYYVAGPASGAGVGTDSFGGEVIARGNVGSTVRVYGPHAVGLQYTVSIRDARFRDLRDRHQSVETLSLSYNFLGHTRFGAVEWRPGEPRDR
jgi:hypothetical protein